MRRKRMKSIIALASIGALFSCLTPTAMADMQGIDQSSWQTIGVSCNAPYDFAVTKATEGTGYVNPYWQAQASCTVSRSKSLGLYHYARGADATAEANRFVDVIAPYIGSAVLALDWESGGNAAWGDGSWVRTWVDRVHARTGVWPVIYVQSSAIGQIPADVRADCALWIAQYASMTPTGYQSQPWNYGLYGEAMRQYTSQGYVGGYGPLDLSLFRGTAAQWRAYANPTHSGAVPSYPSVPTPSPAPAPAASGQRQVVVQPGDTLTSIASRTGLWPVTAWRVPSGNPNLIYIGQTVTYGSAATASAPAARSASAIVRPGDTMSAIAARTGLYPVSAWHAPSGDINLIYPGQTVTYGGTESVSAAAASGHVVRAGESLWSIYGAGWAAAAARNSIRAPYVIHPGQRLI